MRNISQREFGIISAKLKFLILRGKYPSSNRSDLSKILFFEQDVKRDMEVRLQQAALHEDRLTIPLVVCILSRETSLSVQVSDSNRDASDPPAIYERFARGREYYFWRHEC